MRNVFLSALLLCGLFIAAQAHALELSQARNTGLVGEKLDGYVAAVKSGEGVQDLVNSINVRRRAEYDKISKQNGQSATVVGKVAAEQIINSLPSGSFYQGADGSWQKK